MQIFLLIDDLPPLLRSDEGKFVGRRGINKYPSIYWGIWEKVHGSKTVG